MLINKRKELGMTQKQFGDHLFVSRQLISKWEHGERIPDWEQVKVLFGKLELDLKCLVLDELAISKSHERKRRRIVKTISAFVLSFFCAIFITTVTAMLAIYLDDNQGVNSTSIITFNFLKCDFIIMIAVLSAIVIALLLAWRIHYRKSD